MTLTRTEWEILHLLARGMTKKEIAAATHRSKQAVEYHRFSIYWKLGVRNRVQLVRLYASLGLGVCA